MRNREQIHVHESCAIPYRFTSQGVEFCLVSEAKVNRWEFPHLSGAEGFSPGALVDAVATTAGATGRLDAEKPLAEFVAARGGEARSTAAYLLHVTDVDDAWPRQAGRRRLWCLAEEARMRLRRKPLRRLIDMALHYVSQNRNAVAAGAGQTAG
jgi:hypothetical protein